MTLDMNVKNLPKEDTKEDKKVNVQEREIKSSKKPKSKKTVILRIILIVFLLLVLGGIGYLVWKGYIISKDIGFNFNTSSLITNKEPELKKDSSGNYTNVLLVGIDTRENSSLLNTDTIILLSYNYSENRIVMLSIPRDFHVETYEGSKWYQRINAVYASAENDNEGTGLEALTKTVERVTGKEIQYEAMVNFNALVEIIDTVGGIDVNVENSFTDYMYPDGYDYKKVSFVAGPQTMDGKTALEYSRSRHSSQNNEGSDYARARRQQKVISALQEKILSSETLTSPKALMGIISSISNNIKVSEFTIEDVEAGINLGKKYQNNDGKSYSFVLDPTSGNYSLVEVKTMDSGAYATGPVEGFGEYTNIKEYVDIIMQQPVLYSEQPAIYVYNTGLGYTETSTKVKELKEEFPYLNIVFSTTLFNDKEGTVVYSSSEDYPGTISVLSEYLKTENTVQPEYITSKLGYGNVTILLGKEIQLETIEESGI